MNKTIERWMAGKWFIRIWAGALILGLIEFYFNMVRTRIFMIFWIISAMLLSLFMATKSNILSDDE